MRLVARPYWGASLSRRFKLFERGPLRAIFGFGVSYRTETDVLSATHWNFSSQFGLRFQSSQFPAIFELSARHWSNGGVRHAESRPGLHHPDGAIRSLILPNYCAASSSSLTR